MTSDGALDVVRARRSDRDTSEVDVASGGPREPCRKANRADRHRRSSANDVVAGDREVATRLPDRAALARFLARALDDLSSDDEQVGLLVIELGGITSLGHSDAVDGSAASLIEQAATRGRRIVRANDLFCHLGGDVFGIAWRNADLTSQVGLLARVLMSMKASFHQGTEDLFLDVSIGHQLGDRTTTAQTLIVRAERSLVVNRAARRHWLVPVAADENFRGHDDPHAHAVLSAVGVQSPPILVFELGGSRLLHANEQAAELFGHPASRLIGRHVASLIESSSSGGTYLAFAALAAGAIDDFRAHCSMQTSAGSVHAGVSVRTVNLRSGPIAVWTVQPESRVNRPADVDAMPFWSHGVELLVGSLGTDLIVATRDVGVACAEAEDAGLRNSEAALSLQMVGESVLTSLHSDSVDVVREAHAVVIAGRRSATLLVRWAHPAGGWFDVQLSMVATGVADPAEAVAFVLAEFASSASNGELEERNHHLRSELASRVEAAASASMQAGVDWRRIDAMSSRQREVVGRLMRGQRVDSIAADLFLSRSTVRNHLSGAFRLCGVSTQSELVELLTTGSTAQTSDRR